MPPSYQRTNASLAKEYGKAEKRNKADLVLKALQIVDSSIEEIKTSEKIALRFIPANK
jgi:hypothetical protein